MNISSMLLDSGYILADKSSIFMKPDYVGIAYSDGDTTENRIAGIIARAQDLSIFSRELAVQCTDWPSIYHLAGTRANILRPFHSILKSATVLEIGAGCGAITRYLGEIGAQVLALEGSPRRAAIARSRTRDLENVTVVADKFDRFQCDSRFDVITLIGVLEYAPLFSDGENPVVSMLSRAREMLKPEGRLILAIENQLGLKYFAGAAEDHTGESMLGIEGRYSQKGPRTFGRKILAKKLQQAGFVNQQFMAAFPDYKLPVSIITEQGINCKYFDSAALCWQSARRDPQLTSPLVFAPELAWQVVEANGLTLDLANSFLIIAHTSRKVEFNTSTLAYHYSTNGRDGAFCKETLFKNKENENIELIYNPLGSDAARSAEGKHVKFNIPYKGEYIYGEILSMQLLKIVVADNWEIENVGKFLRLYLGIIESYLTKKGYLVNFDSLSSLLPGICFDIIPQNIICLPDGTYQIIDQEWILKEEIPLGWLIYRTLLQLIYSITRFGKTTSIIPETRLHLLMSFFSSIGFDINKETLENYADQEVKIQSDICNFIIEPSNSSDPYGLKSYILKDSVHLALSNQIQQIVEIDAELAAKDAELAAKDAELAAKDAELNAKDTELKGAQYHLEVYRRNEEALLKTIMDKENLIVNINHQLALQTDNNKFLKEDLIKQGQKISFLHTYLINNTFIKSGFHANRLRLRNLKNHYSNIRKIRQSHLFYVDWYKDTYSEIQEFNLNPLTYFYYFGYQEGQNPNPYFDSSWYLSTYEDVSRRKINPLLHYILYGVKEGRNPSPYFNTNWYLVEYKDVKESGRNPLAHYLTHGSKEGKNPNPYFDSIWYKNTYNEIDFSIIEPFLHYITIGFKEGKNPSPYFHTSWYLNKYQDVRDAGIEPLCHYIQYGWKEGRDPNPLFNSKWYVKKYQDILNPNDNPLLHYIKSWAIDLTNPNEFLDVHWYLTMYSDVKEKKLDPLIHFLYYGAKEGKNPSPLFNTNWYLKEYHDVRDSGINPLEHYIQYGQHEGRLPVPDRSTKIGINKTSPVGILCTSHTKYLGDLIAISLKKLSINSFKIYEPPLEGYGDLIYFVICPQMFSYLPEKYISFQMEQTINSRWFNLNYYNILENSLAIFDYSSKNIEFLKNEFGLQNRQLYYVPIDYLKNNTLSCKHQNEIYDVLFYGDPNSERRRKILSEVSQHFNIQIISDTFGDELYEEISKSKIIINIHYYEGALLETTRIWECLSLSKLVISEKSIDINEHTDLYAVVDFIEIYDVDCLIKRIEYWLNNDNLRKQKIYKNNEILNKKFNKFEFFFFRFMLAHENISFDEFWNICGQYLSLDSDKIICLTLPEFPERKKIFEEVNSLPVQFFDGLKHYKYGWIGCGMSYKLMIKLAKQQGLECVTICEDDIEFLDDFEQKFFDMKNYIKNLTQPWDVFSGFMSDISDDIDIKEIITFSNQKLLLINRMISMVFNCYNHSIYDTIISWDETNLNVNLNTIDRFLEQKKQFIIFLSFPFLVDHKDDLQSTIWGFSNAKYNDLINKSIHLLQTKITEKLNQSSQ